MPHSNTILLNTLAHEMRQPLSTIESIAYYLELALPNAEPRVAEHLTRLRQLVAQSGWILSDALTLSQAGAAAPEAVDLDQILRAYVSEQTQQDSLGNRFNLHLDGGPVWMDFRHATQMVSAVCRLLGGAARPGAPVAIVTDVLASGDVQLRVTAVGLMGEDCSPAAGSGLILDCLERMAAANGASLIVRLSDPSCLELTLALPAAPQLTAEFSAFLADEQREPTAPGIL